MQIAASHVRRGYFVYCLYQVFIPYYICINTILLSVVIPWHS